MKRYFAAIPFLLALCMGCSNPHKAKDIETQMDTHGDVSGEKVGVKDGEMVIQKKVLMSEELRRLQNEVYELEDNVYGNSKFNSRGLYGVLKDCKKDLTDPRLGGDGKLTWTEPIERVTDKEDEFKLGLDEQKKLVGVSEEYLKDRITRFREHKRVLLKRKDEYQDKVDVCKLELQARRAKSDKTNSP